MGKYAVEIILALIAASPGVFAYFSRNRAVSDRAHTVAKKTTLDEFNALYGEQRVQLKDCRDQCAAIRQELRDARAELILAEGKVDHLEAKVVELERRLDEETRKRIYYEESFHRRRGE